MSLKKIRNKRCPSYSASCFACPLRDYIICAPAQINCLPVDSECEKKNRRNTSKFAKG